MAYFGYSVGSSGFGFRSQPYYTSGTLYNRHTGFELATKKFSRPYSKTIRVRDLQNLKSQLSITSSIFSQNSAASEQSSILAVQQLQERVATEAEAAKSKLSFADNSLNLTV